jgi:hypothetical protein
MRVATSRGAGPSLSSSTDDVGADSAFVEPAVRAGVLHIVLRLETAGERVH